MQYEKKNWRPTFKALIFAGTNFRGNLFSREFIFAIDDFDFFRDNLFSRISRICEFAKISRSLIFANFAIRWFLVYFAWTNFREIRDHDFLVFSKKLFNVCLLKIQGFWNYLTLTIKKRGNFFWRSKGGGGLRFFFLEKIGGAKTRPGYLPGYLFHGP